jgi:hypothetical protein
MAKAVLQSEAIASGERYHAIAHQSTDSASIKNIKF